MALISDWQRPPERLALHSGEADVWRLRTDLPAPVTAAMMAALPEGERLRAERIRHGGARAGFVVARARLRQLLAGYLGVSPGELVLRTTPAGKPELEPSGPGNGSLHFSVAHSGSLALLAFAPVGIGVDVERVRPVPRAARVARRVFGAPTRTVLESLGPGDAEAAFFAAWTQREAMVKAVGSTVLRAPDPLDFAWPPAALRQLRMEDDDASCWTIAPLPVEAPYAATVVAAGAVERIRLYVLDGE